MKRDALAALAITALVAEAARAAVDERVSLKALLSLTETMYRSAGGTTREGRPSPVDAWTPLIDACGGVGAFAEAIGHDRRTVLNWRRGTSMPKDPAAVRRLARAKGVESPL